MENKDRYSEAVNRINNNLKIYRISLDNDMAQPAMLEKVKSHLVADRVILGEIYEEASRMYRDRKLHLKHEWAQKFKQYRDQDQSIEDSKQSCQLWLHQEAKDLNESQAQKASAYTMMENLTEVVIEIAVKLKNIKIDSRY